MKVVLELGEFIRCDILAWSGVDFGGKRTALRVFPTGNVKGELDSEQVHSMVIRAFHGTRLILCTRSTGDFEDGPWRCVRMVPGHTIPSEDPRGMPGVRLPHLDRLDEPSKFRTNQQLATSYPLVERFDDGESWTFGTTGIPVIEGHVRRIIIEKDDGPRVRQIGDAERMARVLIDKAREVAPDGLPSLVDVAVAQLGEPDGAAFRRWAEKE